MFAVETEEPPGRTTREDREGAPYEAMFGWVRCGNRRA